MNTHKVILRECQSYNIEKIARIVSESLKEFNLSPRGKVLLKPNCVVAHKKYFRYAYTPPEFIEAVVDALPRNQVDEIILGEKCGITIPTRYAYSQAGYWRLIRTKKIKAVCFEEDRPVEVKLQKGKIHQTVHLSKKFVQSDFKIYLPKLKANILSDITGAIKLNIGILDDKERVESHHYDLYEKIADLLEVGTPNLVVMDAITVGQGGSALSTKPFELGAIIVGINPLAVDVVAATILGYNPADIAHLRICAERNYGPISIDEIEIVGDITIDRLKQRATGWNCGIARLDRLDTTLRFYLGKPSPDYDYCYGGCHGSIREALHIIEGLQPMVLKEIRPLSIVLGKYEGDVISPDAPILLIGECTEVLGKLEGKTKKIDVCPISIAKSTTLLSKYGKVKNPYLDIAIIFGFARATISSKIRRFINRWVVPK